MKKTKVNWGVISCAGIAEGSTLPGMLEADNAVLYAISSKTPEKLVRFQEKFNPVKAYDDYEALLNDPEVDAIYLPLPNSLHFDWAVKAAQHKKHVLCEKPLAITAEQVRALKQVFDDNGVLLMEAFASRHNPVLREIKQLMDQGEIGKIKYIETHFCFNLKDKTNVRWVKELGGGATYDVGAYTIGTIRYLLGKEPIEMHTIGEVDPATNVDGTSCILMAFDDGVMATSYCGFNSYGWSGYTVLGDAGKIDVPFDYNAKGPLTISISKEDQVEARVIEAPNNYMLEIEQFGRCILEGEIQLVTYEDSLGNAVLIDEALVSIFSSDQ